MFDKIKKLFTKTQSQLPEDRGLPEAKQVPEMPKVKKPRKPKEKKAEPKLSEKELATKNGEPYIAILKVEIDPENINSGGFELDWNDKFVINLIKAGYKMKPEETDAVIVDRWFQTVCRNIALEVYEQQAADPRNPEYDDLRRIHRKDLGDGRSEIS